MALKENYKDDILDTSQNVKRKYQMENNGDGTVSFTDVTEYTQQGDSFGSGAINPIAHAINGLNNYTFNPSGSIDLVAYIADDSYYLNEDNKYVLADSPTGQALITSEPSTYKALASNTDLYGIEGEDTVSGFEPSMTPIEKGGQVLDTVDEKLNYLVANLNGKGYTNGIVDRSWFVQGGSNKSFTYPEDGVYVVAFLMNRHPDVGYYMSNIVNNASDILYDSGLKQDRTDNRPYRQIQLQIVKARAGETASATWGTSFGGSYLAGIFVVQLKGVRNITVNALKTSGYFTSSYSENIEMAKTYLYLTAIYSGGSGGAYTMNTPRNVEQIVKEPINDSSNVAYPRNSAVGGEIGIVNLYSGDTFYLTCSASAWSHHTLAVLDVTIEN